MCRVPELARRGRTQKLVKGLHGSAPVLAIFGMERVGKKFTFSDAGGGSTPNEQKREIEETEAEEL